MVDEGEGQALGPRDYGRILWRQRWLILVIVLVTVGAALALSVVQTPVYEATADVIIQPTGTQQALSSSPQNAQDAARNVDTETAVLKSKAVADAAKHTLHHTPTVTVSSNSATSDVVSVSARSTSARQAAADASGYAAAYVAYGQKQSVDDLLQAGHQIQVKLNEIGARLPSLGTGSPERASAAQQQAFLQQQLDQLQVSANLNRVGGARILAKADVPTSPVVPQPLRNAAIALALGLLLGIGLAFLREFLDDTVASREDLERASEGLPVLGQIPRVGAWRDRSVPYVVSLDASESAASEAYRTLRTSIEFLGVDRELKSIQITSARAEDGKTTTLANLAVAFARAGRGVAIVCCDLRRPRVHEFFGLSNEVGFTSLLLGEVPVVDALQRVRLLSWRDEPGEGPGEAHLAVLSAGPPAPNPSELLSSGRSREVISSLQKTVDLVLVDSPPVLPVSDALIVSGMVDATLLVASAKSSSRRALHRAVEVLRQVDAPLVGTVLNNAEAVETYGARSYGYTVDSGGGSNGKRSPRRPRGRASSAT